jgi:site-specific DNA-cytosine methylase
LLPGLPESKFADWQEKRLPKELFSFLIASDNTKQEWGNPCVPAIEPSRTIRAGSAPRAFLVHANDQRSMPVRGGDDPAFTIAAASHQSHAPDTKPKAFIVDCQESGSESGLTIRQGRDPMFTVSASMEPRRPARAWLSQGRVVKMTPRALARFQSLPDSYILPDKAGLACTIIGNMAPSLMMQKIVEPLL